MVANSPLADVAATPAAAPAADPAAAAAVPGAPRKKGAPKPRLTFTLHAPGTMLVIGKMTSSDPRYAALKVRACVLGGQGREGLSPALTCDLRSRLQAASRGHTRILLRKTGGRTVREYSGTLVKLDVPAVVKRGEREIVYNQKPSARFLKQWDWEGAAKADEEELKAE